MAIKPTKCCSNTARAWRSSLYWIVTNTLFHEWHLPKKIKGKKSAHPQILPVSDHDKGQLCKHGGRSSPSCQLASPRCCTAGGAPVNRFYGSLPDFSSSLNTPTWLKFGQTCRKLYFLAIFCRWLAILSHIAIHVDIYVLYILYIYTVYSIKLAQLPLSILSYRIHMWLSKLIFLVWFLSKVFVSMFMSALCQYRCKCLCPESCQLKSA